MLLNMVMFKVTICDFGKMNINMTDITEKTENGELVTNRDQLFVVDNIESLIKVIRGQQVMLDRDLATLYGVETKRLNEQVKRNIKRFPEDFMFQLTKDECLRSQIATLNEGRGQHLKYMPYVFTENGVAMLETRGLVPVSWTTPIHTKRYSLTVDSFGKRIFALQITNNS